MISEQKLIIQEDVILNRIYRIRNLKVMLDFDLAELYTIQTSNLKRAVRRNPERFPSDFMFELSSVELKNWRCQFGISNREKMGLRNMPFAFTEYGVLMLASVLNSPRAIQVNIQIVRIFTKLRVLLVKVDGLQEKIEKLEAQYSNHDEKVRLLFEYVSQLVEIKENEENFKDRKQIGFNQE